MARDRSTRRAALRVGCGLAAGCVGSTALAACGVERGAAPPSAAVKAGGTVTAYLITNDVVAGKRYFNDTVFARFNKLLPQIKIDALMGPNADITPKINVEVIAGTGPDIYLTGHPSMPNFINRGAAKDLTEYVKRDSKSLTGVAQAMDTIKESIKDPQGRVWGTPATITDSVMIYNKALFDRYGVKYPDDTLEWNPKDGGSFLDLARKMTRPADDTYGYWWTGQSTADTLSWIKQNNGGFLDATLTKADVLKQATVDACQFQADLVNKYAVAPLPKNNPLSDPARGGGHWLFFQGKVAMMNFIIGQESAWPKDGLQSGAVKVGVAPQPRGVKRASGALGGAWLIAGYAKQPDLAWELIKWWSDDIDAQAGVWTDWQWGLPPSRKVWNDPRVLQAPNPVGNIKPFFDPFEKGYAVPFEINLAWSAYLAAFNKSFLPAMNGDIAMRSALETAQRDVQAVLDEQLPKK